MPSSASLKDQQGVRQFNQSITQRASRPVEKQPPAHVRLSGNPSCSLCKRAVETLKISHRLQRKIPVSCASVCDLARGDEHPPSSSSRRWRLKPSVHSTRAEPTLLCVGIHIGWCLPTFYGKNTFMVLVSQVGILEA